MIAKVREADKNVSAPKGGFPYPEGLGFGYHLLSRSLTVRIQEIVILSCRYRYIQDLKRRPMARLEWRNLHIDPLYGRRTIQSDLHSKPRLQNIPTNAAHNPEMLFIQAEVIGICHRNCRSFLAFFRQLLLVLGNKILPIIHLASESCP